MDLGSRGEAARNLSSADGSVRIATAVSELRAALASLELAFELAERLPPEAVRGPLLEIVRARVRHALESTEALDVQIARSAIASSRSRATRRPRR
jgi:hypothetical protein